MIHAQETNEGKPPEDYSVFLTSARTPALVRALSSSVPIRLPCTTAVSPAGEVKEQQQRQQDSSTVLRDKRTRESKASFTIAQLSGVLRRLGESATTRGQVPLVLFQGRQRSIGGG